MINGCLAVFAFYNINVPLTLLMRAKAVAAAVEKWGEKNVPPLNATHKEPAQVRAFTTSMGAFRGSCLVIKRHWFCRVNLHTAAEGTLPPPISSCMLFSRFLPSNLLFECSQQSIQQSNLSHSIRVWDADSVSICKRADRGNFVSFFNEF